jgi:hypothetical protein
MRLDIQADMFNIFHDGCLIKFTRSQNDVEFTVDIQYLAEMINSKYSLIKGVLRNCTKLEFKEWGTEDSIIYDLHTLEMMNFEIISAEVINDVVSIKCYFGSGNNGGELILITDDIVLFDESGKKLTYEMISEASNRYWRDFY